MAQQYRPSRFIDAAKRGDDAAVFEALEGDKKVDVDKVDSLGETALHWASRAGWVSTMEILLEHNATVNTQDKLGETPLHKAVFKARAAAVQLLMQHNADPSILNAKGESAQSFARDSEILRLLAEHEDVETDEESGEDRSDDSSE